MQSFNTSIPGVAKAPHLGVGGRGWGLGMSQGMSLRCSLC